MVSELDISYKFINELPNLTNYTNLIKLDCSRNNLNTLENLPPNIEELDCYSNNLVNVDNLPNFLIFIKF